MVLAQNSLAAAVGSSVRNTQFRPAALNLPRKILLIGSYLSTITGIANNVPVQILSAEDSASRFGSGSMIHRLAVRAFAGSQGVETWVVPQAEASGSSAAAGSVTFTASNVQAGTLWLYIAGIAVQVNIATGDDDDAAATKTIAAINAETALPVSAAVDGSDSNKVNITAKSKGPWGNDISIRMNLARGQVLPTGLTAVVESMSGGAGTPDIGDALDGLGVGDDANQDHFTDVVHGYGLEATTLDAVATYVGLGNEFVGLYSKTVSRPFRSLNGDTGSNTGGFTAVSAIANGRKTDRASGVISVPNSASHPAEIAAVAMGTMARINSGLVEQSYLGQILPDIHIGDTDQRWTSQYVNRDNAVRNGVSPTRIVSGAVQMQNVVTFYHPDNVPVSSNGYASMRNISILQNILFNIRLNFEQEKWQGTSIVNDVTLVTSIRDRQKARDVQAVIDDLVALARSFESMAWIFSAAFTIERLRAGNLVEIRQGTNGFNSNMPVILSGEGLIFDTVVEFDTSIAVLT